MRRFRTTCIWKPLHLRCDRLPWKYLPNIFLFPSKVDLFDYKDRSKDFMENKFKSIWNSWVDLLGLPSVSPCLFVFQLQEGSGLCWLRRYLVCLLLQTLWRGSYCRWSEIGQTWSSCVRLLTQRERNIFVSSPSNMFYNLLPCYCVLCGFFFFLPLSLSFSLYQSNKCFTSRRAFGSATCPIWPGAVGVRLVVSSWGLHIILEWIGQAMTAETRACCSVE